MDKYLVTLAFLLLLFEVGWLAEDLGWVNINDITHSRSSNAGSTSLGQITMTKGRVRDRTGSSLVWEETHKTHNVLAYESVLTLDESQALVKLHNGTEISLHENTLVTIEPESKDPINGPVRLHFKKGLLYAASDRTPQSIQAGEVIIEAQSNSQITVRSQASADGTSTYQIENHEGNVRIIDPKASATVTLKAGQSLEFNSKDLKTLKNTAVDLEWISPKDGTRIYTHEETINIPFIWKGAIEKINILDRETSDLSFLDVVQNKTEKEILLPLGNYVARLQHDKDETFARNISIWRAPKIYLLQPLPREIIKLNSSTQLIWTSRTEVQRYVWEISDSSDFKNILKFGETSQNQVPMPGLFEGHYYWRVRGIDEQGFSIPELYNNPFQVLTKPLGAPVLKAPKVKLEEEDNEIPPPKEKNQSLFRWSFSSIAQAEDEVPQQKNYFADFQWGEVEGAAGYTIEISQAPDFRKPIVTQIVKKPRFKWKNFKFGNYYWRVAGLTENGDAGLFSEVALTDLTTIPDGPIIPGAPPRKSIPLSAPKSAPLPTPVAEAAPTTKLTPISTPVPTPAISVAIPVATPEPTPNSQVFRHPYTFGVEVGGDYSNSQTLGPDFNASTSGIMPQDFRLTYFKPGDKSDIQGQLEIKKLTVKPQNSNTLPFQNTFSTYTGRGELLFENHERTTHYGLLFLNEYPLLSRNGLESLNIATPFLGGPAVTWNYYRENSRLKLQAALLIGQIEIVEGLVSQTWFIPLGDMNYLTLSFEGRLMGGISFTPTTIFGGQGLFFLGVRW